MTTVTESNRLSHGLTMTTVTEGDPDTELLMQQGFWCWLETIRCKKGQCRQNPDIIETLNNNATNISFLARYTGMLI